MDDFKKPLDKWIEREDLRLSEEPQETANEEPVVGPRPEEISEEQKVAEGLEESREAIEEMNKEANGELGEDAIYEKPQELQMPISKEQQKVLDEEKAFGLSAYKQSDGMNFDDTLVLGLDEDGVPAEKIDVEALDKSIRAFWLSHEKALWAVVVLCGFYFIAVLI